LEYLKDESNGLTEYASQSAAIWENLDSDSFEAFADALAQEKAQREAATSALITSAQSMADMSDFTTEDKAIMSGINDAVDTNLEAIKAELEGVKWHKTKKLSSEEYSQLESAAKTYFNESAKIEGNKIKYKDADGEMQEVNIKEVTDELISTMASGISVERTTK
jgi:hypothetical protein